MLLFFNPYNPDFPSAHIKLSGHCCMFFLFPLVYVYLVIIEKYIYIREACLQYKSTFPDNKIGFSKFVEL